MSINNKDNNLVTLTSLMTPHHTAVVTGAASGIGRAACHTFAVAGMRVWMIDVDADALQQSHAQVVQSCSSLTLKQRIIAKVLDVADAKAVQQLAEQVFAAGHGCHILFNNAGTGQGGGALSTDRVTVERVMSINVYGPIHACVAFVPRMKESKQPGMIIHTGSKNGITLPPGNLTYNMSKAALKCYTEGLEHELMKDRMEGEGKLRAVLLLPGWVNTNILINAERAVATVKGESYDPSQAVFHENKPHAGAWMPSQVMDELQQQVDEGKFYILCPDNDVDRDTDHARMTWAMNDIVLDRPPMSRWHPDYQDEFQEFVAKQAKTRKT